MNVDVQSVERAIVAAVAPAEVLELRGWIAAFDSGTVNRARSAAPLSHGNVDAGAVPVLVAHYRDRDMKPTFRVPEAPRLAGVEGALGQVGLEAQQPTDVQVASSAGIAQCADAAGVRIDAHPDEAWAAVFLGEGFDPVDGASRVRTLTRAAGSLFASIREGERAVAAGVLAFGHGWASIHGMRTALSHRGRGLATRVMAALARAAIDRAHERLMLQVERANAPAQALYARLGFERAWTYHYWRQTK